MANNLTDFLANEFLDHVIKGAAYTPPTVLAFALYSTPTDDSSGGTELADTLDYARLVVEGSSGLTFSLAAGGQTDNDQQFDFPAANGGDWAAAVGIKLHDSAAHSGSTAGGGNALFHGPLTAPKTAADGDNIFFPAASLVLGLL